MLLQTLQRIVLEVSTAPDVDTALAIIVKRLRKDMRTEVASVYLLDPTRTRYVLMATEGLLPEAVGKVSLGLSEGLVGLVALREEPINLENAALHPKFRYFKETGEEKYSAFLGVPIIHHKKVLGVLVVQQTETRRFDQSEEAFLVTISAQLAGVIAHAQATGLVKHGANVTSNTVAKFHGVSGGSGVGIGEGYVHFDGAQFNTIPFREIKADEIDEEIMRFKSALQSVKVDIQNLSKQFHDHLPRDESALFDVYLRMLDDLSFEVQVVEKIKQCAWPEYALAQVILSHVHHFGMMDDLYLRERASDIKEMGLRILSKLEEATYHVKQYPAKTVLVGEEITTPVLLEVPKDQLVGVVTSKGSRNSHMAIVARSLGIPTVVGVLNLPVSQLDAHQIIVDGYKGEVITNPHPELKKHYERIQTEEREFLFDLENIREEPSVTQDGTPVKLLVNTGLMIEVMRSLYQGAEGVGLYRTEIPFMSQDRFPGEEEQAVIYRQQLQAFAPKPVTMRTLDIGGDKSLSYFPIKEDNPFLGWRGIRVTLDHPEILMVQLRALLKASAGLNNLRILFPMISNVFEVEEALRFVHRAYSEVIEEGIDVEMPLLGVMIEVPASVYQAKELAQRVDFISIGTNDLTQYLLAVDRTNPRVADLYDTLHPAVLMAVKQIYQACIEMNKPVTVCGELAGDPLGVLLLLGMGYRAFSMSGSSLLKVKWLVRNITMQKAEQLLKEVSLMDNGRVIRSHVELFLQKEGLLRFLSTA